MMLRPLSTTLDGEQQHVELFRQLASNHWAELKHLWLSQPLGSDGQLGVCTLEGVELCRRIEGGDYYPESSD